MMKFSTLLNNSLMLNEKLVRKIIINKPHRATILIFDWEEMTSELYASIFSKLSKKEIGRAKSISHLKRKREYIMARALTRTSLSWFCQSDQGKSLSSNSKQIFPRPEEWEIKENKFGKPYVTDTYYGELNFNITHTDQYLAIAITIGNEIGIDLETVRTLPMSPFPSHLFTKNELKTLEKLDDNDHCMTFAKLWTAKEAAAKCLGEGMFVDFSKIEIKMDEIAPIKILANNKKINDLSLQNITLQSDKQAHQLSIAFSST